MKALLPILIIAALLLGSIVGRYFAEVVCDHPNFIEGKLAPYSMTATCENGIQVTILD